MFEFNFFPVGDQVNNRENADDNSGIIYNLQMLGAYFQSEKNRHQSGSAQIFSPKYQQRTCDYCRQITDGDQFCIMAHSNQDWIKSCKCIGDGSQKGNQQTQTENLGQNIKTDTGDEEKINRCCGPYIKKVVQISDIYR